MHYLPDIDNFRIYAEAGFDTAALNSGGLLVAIIPKKDETTTLQSMAEGAVAIRIHPYDPFLRRLGIRYAAFDQTPKPEEVSGLRLMSPEKVSGFWIYELP
jgi:hypothetical protein